MNLGNDKALWFLFVVPVVLLPAYIWCFWQKTRALRMLACNEMLKKINVSVSLKKQIFKAVLLVGGFISIVIALTEYNGKTKEELNRQLRKIEIFDRRMKSSKFTTEIKGILKHINRHKAIRYTC